MADIEDNYIIVGASGDNLNCDDTGGWQKGGNANDPTQSSNKLEGDYSLGLQTSDKDESWWYHDITDGYRFKITEKDLGVWFYYIKGKGDNFLVQDSTAIVIKLFFGGTDKYAEYRVTEKGDLSLKFGWQMLMCSGTELNGGATGGGHNGGSDFDLDIHRIEFRLNCAVKVDVDLNIDAFFVGNTITINGGDNTDPITIEDIADYTFNTRSFPIGTVEMSGKLANIKSGLTINNGGYVSAENIYLLFNQLSNEVKHNITITDGTFRIGKIENNKPLDGCQIVKPQGMTASILVDTNGVFEVYNSKFYRWEVIEFNGTCSLNLVDFDSCELVKFNSNNNSIEHISIHDSINNLYDYAMEVLSVFNLTNDILLYRCKDGIRFSENSELNNLKLLDNTGYDLDIIDSKTATIDNATYSTVRRS